ncbi:DUF488 domain-containing protein [Granulicella cerasi]|uniref:DUF488 domain-containing protein n=1 Tax=Granulicella cerasi TaxID=741063 RepID=UPI0021E04679|nr:DUF488 domain-containing protein [Granulicella cerasi]
MMNYRQKTLLGLLSAFGGHLANTDFQKYLFLYTQEFQQEPSFEFVPYRFGGFSFQSYADKQRLVDIGALADAEDWQLKEGFATAGLFDEAAYSRCYEKYSHLHGTKLLQDVYRRYPYYATKSERAAKIMNDQELSAIAAARPAVSAACFFTIGYEGSSLEGYLNRLIRNNVKTLVDVRRNPLSRKYGFSKKTLSDTVRKLGIGYVHIPELGIASDRRQELNTQADYDRLFNSYEKQELKQNSKALQDLFDLFLKDKRVAITCFEASVCMCHRGRVAKAMSALPDWKYDIRHI